MFAYSCDLPFVADMYVGPNTGYYEDGRIKYKKVGALRAAYCCTIALVNNSNQQTYPPVVFELHKLVRCWRIPNYNA